MVLPIIDINIVSDLACPWCYVGKKRLDKAMQAYQSRAQFQLHWHPYMIDIATKPQGEDYMAYNQRRWGSDGWTAQLRRSGQPDGALFANWKTWPNTLHAHRLARFAEQSGKGSAAQDSLFEQIYEKGGNVSDKATLAQVAEQLQLQGAESFLESNNGSNEVAAEDAEAKHRKIRGVPYYLIGADDAKEVLSGAQSVDAFLTAFAKTLSGAK